jgi:hypothetical protein
LAGIGSKLIDAYLAYLRAEAVKGVHLATMSDKAGSFFSKMKFKMLFKRERSYFGHILKCNVPIYIFGMYL